MSYGVKFGVKLNARLLALGALATVALACRPVAQSKLADVESAPIVCDETALAAAIAAKGVVAALESDAAKCLDTTTAGPVIAADEQPAASAKLLAQNSPLPSSSVANDAGLALTGSGHKTDVVVVIGYEIMNDVLNAVAQATMNGASTPIDGQAFKAQARDAVAQITSVIQPYSLKFGVTLYYSYPDLAALVKANYVDPLVYGYDGIFHNVIHRRYANGRGLVYRIAMQKLAEGLGQFDGIAAQELAAINTDSVYMTVRRHPGALSTGAASNVTLWQDGAVVGQTVPYAELKSLALKIRDTAKAVLSQTP